MYTHTHTHTIESHIEFFDHHLLPTLFGESDANLQKIESSLEVKIRSRGNLLTIVGNPMAVAAARMALEELYAMLQKNSQVDVVAAIESGLEPLKEQEAAALGGARAQIKEIVTTRKTISARTPGQAEYINVLHQHKLVFALGPAGTGKTYLAAATAISMLLQGKVERIVMSRPAVEAGEKLGYLPGDMREKVDPYLRPLYDALYDMLPGDQLKKRLDKGEIEVAPLAFMRGRTLSNAYVILDEAQNTTVAQMKMFLTRMGKGSYVTVTGDVTQIDLPFGQMSGLKDAARILQNVPEIGFITLQNDDIVRHPLVRKIVAAYEEEYEKHPHTK